MKMNLFFALCVAVLFVACEKKEPQTGVGSRPSGGTIDSPVACEQEIVAREPVKVGETGMILPAGTKICITANALEACVELPAGYSFVTTAADASAKPLPVLYATYACYCSQSESACQVFYAEGLGFGCLQSSCTGSCTGKFTYKGYSVDRVVSTSDKAAFFELPEVKQEIAKICEGITDGLGIDGKSEEQVYVRQQLFGIWFYLLMDRSAVPVSMQSAGLIAGKDSCDCEGTNACTLKTVTLPSLQPGSKLTIYFCEGSCNGCELTVE